MGERAARPWWASLPAGGLALGGLLLATAACGGGGDEESRAASPPASLPESPAASGALFTEDFSAEGRWPTKQDPELTAEYADGAFRMLVSAPGKTFFNNVTFRELEIAGPEGDVTSLKGIAVEVEATKTAGPDGSAYGVTCGLDTERYYAFRVRSGGTHAVVRGVGGATKVVLGSTEPSDAVKTGDATNRIRGECTVGAGNQINLRLIVNGRTLLEGPDEGADLGLEEAQFTAVGLIAESPPGESGTDVRFDNLAGFELS